MRRRVFSVTKVLATMAMVMAVAAPIKPAFTVSAETTTQTTVDKYSWGSVKIVGGGFITGIIYNPGEKDVAYARTDMGGAYKWDPATKTWTPLTDWVGFDDWNLLGCESLAADPVETNRVYVAAGTYNNDWTDMNGYILRSADYGKTWDKVEMPFKMGGNMPGRSMGERLAVDPNDNKVLYFGARTGDGLWRSKDYGATWEKVTSLPTAGDYKDYYGNEYGVLWVTYDTTSSVKGEASKTIYVGVADSKNSIYKSTDGGATWAPLAGQPTLGDYPHHSVLASDGNMYITYSDTAGPYDGAKGDVWKYNTKTSVWTKITPVDRNDSSNSWWGYGGLTVDTQNPNTLMVTTLNSWWPDGNIFRSTDGGTTWTRAWDFDGYPTRKDRYKINYASVAPWLNWGTNATAPEETPKLGWMMGDIEIDPFNSNNMLYGTGATLYGSNDLTNWDKNITFNIDVKAEGIEEAAVQAVVSPTKGPELYSGMYDIGGFTHTDVNVAPKMLVTPTLGAATGIDYAEGVPNFVVRAGSGSEKTATSKYVGFSYDSGSNWFTGGGALDAKNGMIAVNYSGTAVVWSPSEAITEGGTNPGVHYTTNNGNSWTKSTGIPAGAKVRSDRVNPNKFYGFSGGNFYISTDAGKTFTATAATGLPTSGTVNFKAMIGVEGDIWLAANSPKEGITGMFHSTDSGATFTKLSNVEAADTVGFGKAKEGESYMAIYSSAKVNGVRGFFRSTDAGKTWLRINDNDHQYGCTNADISGDPKVYGRVYVATNGRGIVMGNVDTSVIVNPTLLGDVDGNGTVNAIDFALLKKYILNNNTTTINKTNADMNGDKLVNAIDFALLKKKLLA